MWCRPAEDYKSLADISKFREAGTATATGIISSNMTDRFPSRAGRLGNAPPAEGYSSSLSVFWLTGSFADRSMPYGRLAI
jgi:hypothetical protein